MNPAHGTLQDDGVIVTKAKDVGRLYGKSRFGTPLSKNYLHLDFIEACFLFEEKKLLIYQHKTQLNWEDLISIAATQPTFETRYLIFSDLRRRGHQIQLLKNDDFFTFFTKNQLDTTSSPAFIAVFSEREQCTIQTILTLIKKATKQQTNCWLAIADEEGDITYYELSSQPLTGKQKPFHFRQTTGILLQDRVLIFDEELANLLHEKEFFGKAFGNGLQISLVEALYLKKENSLTIRLPNGDIISEKVFQTIVEQNQPDIKKRYIVYRELKSQGLIVKTGFKFGNHFRAYIHHPYNTHAEFLIHAVSVDYSLGWPEVSRAIRLAHSVNKTFLFASIDESELVTYLAFKRIRP
ncbi:MAG: tRNA-intron lyase [Candidatus Thermoplasmatota archaeon]|nr:tRNA-intron lyase [Candidatus Thermoplasmatota archaeon]